MSEGAPSPRLLQRRADALGRRLAVLRGRLDSTRQQLATREAEVAAVRRASAIAADVTAALELLSRQMLDDLTAQMRESLTLALGEVLNQPLQVGTEVEYKNNALKLTFSILRGENEEHIMRGQGGSVINVLSVALRLFAVRTLDPASHRPFIVLDEQDCWLRPDLVPRLTSIIHQAARALGFQVLIISHHDVALFEPYADAIHELHPTPEGVQLKRRQHVVD